MVKKRKSIASSLDEVDRTMYAFFCSGANSLSQLYTQAMNHQKLSFQSGERHGLEKLYQWILKQQERGLRVTTMDILNYLQNELDCCGEEPLTSPQSPIQHQPSHPNMYFTNSSTMMSSSSTTPSSGLQVTRSDQPDDQSKNSVFSNALSSPVRQSLQHYHITQGGYNPNSGPPSGNPVRTNEANFPPHDTRDSNPVSSNDSAMDMHADSPAHDSTY